MRISSKSSKFAACIQFVLSRHCSPPALSYSLRNGFPSGVRGGNAGGEGGNAGGEGYGASTGSGSGNRSSGVGAPAVPVTSLKVLFALPIEFEGNGGGDAFERDALSAAEPASRAIVEGRSERRGLVFFSSCSELAGNLGLLAPRVAIGGIAEGPATARGANSSANVAERTRVGSTSGASMTDMRHDAIVSSLRSDGHGNKSRTRATRVNL